MDSTLSQQGISNKKIIGVKTLTNAELEVHMAKSGSNISIVKIESDIESPNDLIGPWFYKNGRKVSVYYSILGRIELGVKCISLTDVIRRGFPKFEPPKFQWYSWLRFKSFADEHSNLDKVLSLKEDFMSCLKDVHEYYSKHPEYVQPEGLEKFKGPQSYDDTKNKQLLHYYGSGWYQWYKKSVFEQQMVKIFGDETALTRLKLLGSDPWTEKVSPQAYEQLLRMTHDAIRHHLGQNNWRDKLIPFSGPQCHEDRGNNILYDYNPDMRLKNVDQKATRIPSNKAAKIEKATKPPVELPDIAEDNVQNNDTYEDIFKICSFRVCEKCKKTRILDNRAREKYPLGYYDYGGKSERVRFECSRLVATDCTTPDDVMTGDIKEDKIRLLVLKSENPLSPTSALLLENQTIFEETYSRKIFDVNVIGKYCAKGDNVDRLRSHDLLAEYKVSGSARIGIKARRGFLPY